MNHWKRFWISVLFLFLVGFSWSQELITTSFYEVENLGVGYELEVSDPLYLDEQVIPSDFKVSRRFRVELFYNRNSHSDTEASSDWRVGVKLKNIQTGEIKDLSIEKRTGFHNPGVYSSWVDFMVPGYEAGWVIESMSFDNYVSSSGWQPTSPTNIPLKDVHIECMVFNTRIVALSENICPRLSLNSGTLNWEYVKGAIEYDVEWVFIDDYDSFTYNSSHPSGPFEFKEPVRITTYKHSHQVDLIYPKGTVYYRIRPKGYFFRTGNQEVYYAGNWCYGKRSGGGNMFWVSSSDHEGLKTWQYNVSYAENGLAKSSISYFDGTLRTRQQLTQMNSTGQVVAAGTVYDHEGRQSVQIMPTPVSNGSLDYYGNLHVDNGGGIFDKEDFDLGTSNPMGISSGAGRYFSSANDFNAQEPFRDRIPNANGYAYNQTKFHHDNTGRPVVRSGIGEKHRMGGGHESYFYYVKPTERNLRELFGSNVGASLHYDKYIQVDANGQATVTYTDQLGRTIASGIYGGSPDNLLDLDNNPLGNVVAQPSDLMPSNTIETDLDGNLKSVTDYYHMNMGSNDITLTYDLVFGELLQDGSIFGAGNCASCLYELEIHITDPTGQAVDLNYTSQTDGQTYSYIYEKYSGDQIDCSSSTFIPSLQEIEQTYTFTKTGAYRIEKTLKADASSISSYIAANASILSGAPNLTNLTNAYLANTVTLGCSDDCQGFYEQDCREELGLATDILFSALTATQQTQVLACINTKCEQTQAEMELENDDAPSNCEMLLNMLKGDVSPTGWVFNEDQGWRSDPTKWQLNFTNADGTSFTPSSLEDLENNWEDQFADQLVHGHPEYCHYTKCVAEESLKEFDNVLMGVSTMADAIAGGYINSSYLFLSVSSDPLYSTNPYSGGSGAWLNGVNSNYGTGGSIYDFVTGTLLGGVSSNPALTQDASGAQIPQGTPAYDNLIWSAMRALFLGERMVYMESLNTTCQYYDHPSANFRDPTEVPQIVGGHAQGYPGYVDDPSASCPGVCSNNVNYWLGRIEDECYNLTSAQLEDIRMHLYNYCLTDCDGVSNMTGMIQMSDLLVAPINTDLQAVQTILAGANCGGFDLNDFAIDDTCATPVTQFLSVASNDAGQVKVLALLSSVKNSNYTEFSAILATINPAHISNYNQVHFDGAMTISFYNGTTNLVTYPVNDIAEISVTGQGYNGVVYETVVRVVKTDGTIYQHVITEYRLLTLTTQGNATTQNFPITIPSFKRITVTMCEDVFASPFDLTLDDWEDDCVDDINQEAEILAQQEYDDLMESLLSDLLLGFESQCFGGSLQEKFTITYNKQEYAFTLYYYDQAGNLVQTVPPQGVHIVPNTAFDTDGKWDGTTEPQHLMKTMYTYNSLGQMLKSQTPDGGKANFYYNYAQQLRLSQNAQQLVDNECSYTRYDALGRAIEVGVTPLTTLIDETLVNNIAFPVVSVASPTSEVVRSFYDEQPLSLDGSLGWNPTDLNTRISAVTYYDSYTGDDNTYASASFYEYDIHGNVKRLLNDYPVRGTTQRYKFVDYAYELYSGKVLRVTYQKDQDDQFIHRYTYDDDNRITAVYTSRDGIKWDEDAEYFYFLHGPLARTELGDNKVQGIDYAYTVHGWLKGVNSNTMVSRRDLGKDGSSTKHINRWTAEDAFGYSLTYYDTDYSSIVPVTNQDNNWLASNESSFMPTTGAGLYNGNIRSMVTAVRKMDNNPLEVLAKVYQYDQLQRIKEAKTFRKSTLSTDNSWLGGTFSDIYYSSYDFDLNGNITKLQRKGDLTGVNAVMDNFTYNYFNGAGGSVPIPSHTNKLLSVVDDVNASNYDTDIDPGQHTVTPNYHYDAIGRLTKDVQEKILRIEWTVTNKVAKIIRVNGSGKNEVTFKYDPMGNRIAKTSLTRFADGSIDMDERVRTTYYVRDAQGNLMATYYKDNLTPLELQDFELYGSSRLGVQNVSELITSKPNFDYCSNDNKASAIIELNGSQFTSGEMVSYRIGGLVLNDGVSWNGNTTQSVAAIVRAVNQKTVITGVEAEVWWSDNTVNSHYIKFTFIQPGNWNGSDDIETYANGIHKTGSRYIPRRPMGYGACKGQDIVGTKRYELSNHLGNVLAVITDRKWAVDKGVFDLNTGLQTSSIQDGNPDYYQTEVVAYNDYYPYGMLLPNRHGSEGEYRFGYNTQEKTDEIKGSGNHYTAKFWEYDPRVVTRWNRDPITYPWQSPYAINNNNPIVFTDPLGLFGTRKEARQYKKSNGLKGRVQYDKNDGIFAINNKKAGTSLFRDASLENVPNLIGRQDDGVISAVLVTAKRPSSNSPSLSNYNDGLKEFGKRGGNLTKTNAPLKSTGKIKYYDNNWGGNQYVKTSKVFSTKLTKGIAKKAPVIGHLLNAKEVYDGIQKDGGIHNMGANTAKELAGVAGGAGGAWAGAAGGAAIGSLIFPGVGTVIGGVIGGVLGSWGGEAAAEAIVEEIND